MDCQAFDPVQLIFAEEVPPEAKEHAAVCESCADDLEGVIELMYQKPLGEELLAAYEVIAPGVSSSPSFMPRLPNSLAEEILPLLADEISEGRNFASFVALEPMTTPPPFRRLRLKVTGTKGQLVPIDMPVKVRYNLDEDAEVLVVHEDGKRGVQILFPSPPLLDSFWRAGEASFTGTIEGRHGERQQFVILATKVRVLPDQDTFAKTSDLGAIYRQSLERARVLPPDQWCKANLPYTVIDLHEVEKYRLLEDLVFLEAACIDEIHNEKDLAKTACSEVCYRMLDSLGSKKQARSSKVQDLFIVITNKLIRYWAGNWRGTWEDQVLQDDVQEVYFQFFQTAQRRSSEPSGRLEFVSTLETASGQLLQVPCYTALLAYLKIITFRVVCAEWQKRRRVEVRTFIKYSRNKAVQLSTHDKALWQKWVYKHVLDGVVDQMIFAGVLAGTKPRVLLHKHAEVREVFGQDNKKVANARDAILRRVYREIQKQQPAELLPVLQRLMALTVDTPDDEGESG